MTDPKKKQMRAAERALASPNQDGWRRRRRMSDNTIIDDAAKRMTDTAMGVYKEHNERAALRCATGDAASLCAAVLRFIGTQNRTKHGRISKHGQELQAIAKLCGDEIWKMRDRIGFD